MQIVVRGNALHKSETNALDQIQKRLRDSWFGYASVLVADKQGSMEFDLIIVTHDRVLVVELKEWHGKLTNFDGNWIITTKRGEQNRGKSAYHRKRDQGYRLATILKTELEHKLGYYPYVEAHVVLCGSATPEHLPENERRFVHTLEDFLQIGGKRYEEMVQSVNMIRFDTGGRVRPNQSQAIFDSFFRGNRVELADFQYLEYTAAVAPDRVHDQHLFSEYPATKAGPPVSGAMMRRWDLAALGLAFHDDETWRRVVTREDFIYRTANAANSQLEDFLLRPLSPMVEDNITSDCVELFELRKNTVRLEQHLNLNGHKWTVDDRLDLTKALLAPFAEMHSMGFAHRDIDTQNLWYSQDARIVLASSFHAAFVPDKGTVKDLAERLKSNSTLLPEDVYASEGDVLSPFAKDVYLLALVAHKICFHGAKFVLEEGIPVWRTVANDPFDGKLNDFFAKAMDLEQRNRYANAMEMLAELNSVTAGKSQQHEDAQEVIQEIARGDFLKTDLNPFMLMSYFPPAPGAVPEHSVDKMVYRCVYEGEEGLFKFWPKANVDLKNAGANRRILRMRKRIEQSLEDELPLPALLTYGMFGNGNGLFVVTRFEEGTGWPDYVGTLDSLESKLEAASALCGILKTVHGLDFAHGDLHPGNILVRPSQPDEPPSLIFIDALDFGDTSDPYNVEYGPIDPTTTGPFGRDCYAVYQIVEELLGDQAPQALVTEFQLAREQPGGVPVAIDPLDASIKAALDQLRKPPAPAVEPLLFIADAYRWPAEATLLQAAEAAYYLHVDRADRNAEYLYIRITAQDKRLAFNFDPVSGAISSHWVGDVSFGDYISAGHKAQASFSQPIAIQKGVSTKANEEALARFILTLEPVQAILKKKVDSEDEEIFDDECDGLADSNVKPSAIWKTMLETEGDQLMRVEIAQGRFEESPSGALLIPYTAGSEQDLDFSDEVTDYGIYLEGESRPFGELVVEECSSQRLAVRMFAFGIRSVKQKLVPGTELIFESKPNNASRERRKKAMEQVLNGVSKIPHLPAYFDPNSGFSSKVIGKIPDEAVIRQRYDTEHKKLNPRQVVAFQRTISEGPISSIQGPPGTGKTDWVCKIIHYLFENNLAENILLVGQSHTSVDNVALKTRELCAELQTDVAVVRLGHEAAIDDQMLQCHSSSIQRQIRFKFQREYEKRINALSSRLLLSQDLVEELAKLHRSIGPILDRIRTYTKQKDEVSGKRQLAEETRVSRIAELDAKIESCVESLQHHMDSRGYEFNLPSPAAPEFWSELSTQVARNHQVTNQLALQRLNALINISQDWIDVLGSGAANYDRFLVKTSQLVCGTLVGIGAGNIHIDEMEFDWVIIDEAGRAQASELMIAMQCGRRVLLVGDHKQLAPMYEKKHIREVARKLQIDEREAVKTDFERAFEVNNGIPLDTQYRMIEPIGDIISNCFYDTLKSHRKQADDWYSDMPYPLNKPVTWVDSGSGELAVNEDEPVKGQYANKHEVAVCLHMLKQLAKSECMEKLIAKRSPLSPHPIGVITMYRGQKRMIEEVLSRAEWAAPLRDMIKVGTVDSVQGDEASIIFLSLVRNNDKGLQGFLVDASRINVALSRAKDRLVIIGSKRMWSGANAPSALGGVVSYITQQHAAHPENYEIVDGTTVLKSQRHE